MPEERVSSPRRADEVAETKCWLGATVSRRSVLLASAVTCLPMPVLAQSTPIYRDRFASIPHRVEDLLSRMTIEEKVQQLRCMAFGRAAILDDKGRFSPTKAAAVLENGIGQLGRPGNAVGNPTAGERQFLTVEETVAFVNSVQAFLLQKTRLGIPAIFHDEIAHGYMGSEATVFPSPTGLASTWAPDLVEAAFTVTARETRLRGGVVGLGPVVDLARDPRWGRVEEFFSEDPCLVAQMGLAATRGLQGRTRPIAKDRIFATLKHFVHGAPDGGVNLAPADMSERTLRATYLIPFETIIKQGDPAIIMPSYNEVGGVPAHANAELLTMTGRQRLGFKGAYFSDYNGVTNLVTQHHVAGNDEDAARLAINAGVDAELPEGRAFQHLPKLVAEGKVAPSTLDEAVRRVLALKFEAGLFEQPYIDTALARKATNTPADIALARRIAEKSIILLKNNGILPLDRSKPRRLAVIGPNAAEARLGGYSGTNAKAVSLLEGLKAAFGPTTTIGHAQGVRIIDVEPGRAHAPRLRMVDPALNSQLIAEAVALAQQSDLVILAVGDQPEVTREAIYADSPGDRDTLGLFGDQDRLVEAILATGKPVVCVLINGRALAVNALAARADALVEAWYPGQEGGHALANVLLGQVNPGGKLTVSFPKSVGDLPIYYNRHPSADLNRYIEGRHEALYPFGHGLSYTSFDLSAPRLGKATIAQGEAVSVEVDVTNTGPREGDEVIQIYIRDEVSSVPRPMLELKDFRRVTLAAGEKRTIRFTLTSDMLAFWDANMRWVVEPGTFRIFAGNSSQALKDSVLTVT
jgi:beta-glucosidase